MKKTMKKLLCSLLVVVMCLTAVPLQGFVELDLSVNAADSVFNLTKVLKEGTTYKISWQDVPDNNLLGYKIYRINRDDSETLLGIRAYSSAEEYVFYDDTSYQGGDGLEYSYRIEANYEDGSTISYFTDYNDTYKVGDIIQFGSYPQTEVKDEAVIEKLNSLAPVWDEWTSYGYYSGDGNYGSMVQGDWMRYIDIVYNGNKYRGLKFTQYRPDMTLSASPFSAYDGNHTNQDENGYYINKNYWFEFEPINWRILDPNSGLVMCEALIDSQPYSNTIYSNDIGNFGGIFNDRFYDNYASDYETSSIRKWLNNEFYDLAFTGDEKEEINTTVLNNNSYYTTLGIAGYGELDSKETEDKIFIPSYDEVINIKFGFHSDPNEKDTARMAEATDYSKCQGAFVVADEYKNNTHWILRSPGGYSNWCCSVYRSGKVDGAQLVYCSDAGVRPALRLKDLSVTENIKLNYETYTVSNLECPMIRVTDYPSGYTKDDIVWTSSNEHVIKMNGDVPEPIHSGKANVIATTKDGKYSASCEVTVKASFVMTSPSNDTESIMEGKTAEFYFYLNDFSAERLSVDDVELTIDGENHLKLLSKKIEDNCLKLTVEGLTSGYSIINLESKEYEAANRFQIYVYPESIEYRADKVPVLDEEMKTNFFRSGYTVEAFDYVYNEATDTYIVTMNIYNEIGVSPVVVAHSNNGNVYDFAAAKRFVGMPGDFGDFLGTLASGLGQFMTGDMFTYRTQTYAEKTEIEVEVPSDGYITISNDRKISPFVAVYNALQLCVEMSFVSIDLVTGLTEGEKARSKDVTEAFMEKLSDIVPDFNDLIVKIASKICKKSVDGITVATLAELSEYSFDMVNELCEAAGCTFADILYDVLASTLNKTFDTAIKNNIIKGVIRNNILTVENFKTLEKYTEPIFKAGEFIYLAEFILRYFNYSSNTGMTNIQFNTCGEEGFLCKDKIRVKSDVITDEVLLHHYVIIDNQPHDAFIRNVIDSDFGLDNQPDDKEISIDLNRITEVHEISLKKNGKDIDTVFRAIVEIELPSHMNKNTCSVYRVEKDGTYTKLKTTIQGNNVVFETDHFSHYIVTGIRNDIEGTTPCDVHVYDEVRTEPSCTEAGSITYTCYCGDTYTETIEAIGHTDSEWIVDKDSTCSAEGSKHIECTVCEEVLKTEAIAKLPHNYSSVIKEATCETGGYTTYTCTCGDTYTGDKTPAKGHDYSEGICTTCGDSKIDDCTCNCHKGGISGLIWKILRFFYKLFKINPVCDCGLKHY